MACYMGIDIGSSTTKGVILRDGVLEAYHILSSGVDYRSAALDLKDRLLKKAGLLDGDLAGTIATGHGAGIIPLNSRHIADMLCCARGINNIFPSARTVIDVQGQSSQVIQIDEKENIVNFAISEACASCSGCFLEVITNVLRIELDDIGPLSLNAKKPVTFTTGCAVFGESEAITRVAEGVPKEDILAGVHKALSGKLLALISNVGLNGPYAISGGGGMNIGLIASLGELGIQLLVPDQPQIVNALGAAIIAEEQDTIN